MSSAATVDAGDAAATTMPAAAMTATADSRMRDLELIFSSLFNQYPRGC